MLKKIFMMAPVTLFFIMLLFSSDTKAGALNGLNLWFFTIVPTLLPFMIITAFIMENGSYVIISGLAAPVMKPLFNLPTAAGFPFMMGMLCGFPMGSKLTADMVKSGKLSLQEGNTLLTFCNNISPPFIISFVSSYVLNLSGIFGIMTVLALFISPVLTGIITSHTPMLHRSGTLHSASSYIPTAASSHPQGSLFDRCIVSSSLNILRLGGYIMSFSIICSILNFFISDGSTLAVISGLLEITTGLELFSDSAFSLSKYLLVCTLTSFGGICAIAQTGCMIHGSGLSLKIYAAGRLLNSSITLMLTYLLYNVFMRM